MALLVGAVCVALIIAGGALVFSLSTANKTKECEASGQVYDKDKKRCREKTISERFDERCSSGVFIGGSHYSCADIKRNNLERAYLNDALVKHGASLYEAGTTAEISAGKNSGDYCLSATESWFHIGEKHCVVFNYAYMACSNGYCFLDEREDYKNGFVAFFGKYGMFNWNTFRAKYYNKGPILVCGTIYQYQGHPEIKITNVQNQTILSPQLSFSGGVGVYRYSCN